jgi:FMN phosphatase YigB (HAD superfamily)
MVYVGDEYEKDVVGALGAGWDAVWICRDGGASRRERVMWLEDEPVGDLFEALDRGGGAVGFGSLARLGEWLFKGT